MSEHFAMDDYLDAYHFIERAARQDDEGFHRRGMTL